MNEPDDKQLSDSDSATGLLERTEAEQQPAAAVPPDLPTEYAADANTDALEVPRIPHLFWHPLLAVGWIIRTAFGIVTLILLLAIVAAIPLVNFLALGYLLDVEGRVARTGRLRYAFPLLDLAPKVGSIVLGIWVCVFPLRLMSGAVADARLIDPTSTATAVMQWTTTVLACLVALHLCAALGRGGGFWTFLRPIKNIRWLIRSIREGFDWGAAEAHVSRFLTGLRLKHHFLLGVYGFIGALIWLILPTALFAASNSTEGPSVLVTVIGGAALVVVLGWLPFLQAHFAAENRLTAMFELKQIRQLYRRAPLAWMIATVGIYVLSLPLYLLKVVAPPQDAMWFVTIVFIVSIYPARVVAGWAYSRAVKKEHGAWFGFRWLSRSVCFPLLSLYVFLLFFTQFIAEHGKRVLFEHHVFLLPVPF